MARVGRPVDPNSLSSRILELLSSHPGTPVTVAEMASQFGVKQSQISSSISNPRRRAGSNSPWARVVPVHFGSYVFRPEGQAGDWTLVGEHEGSVVLTGPDGQLWVARRL